MVIWPSQSHTSILLLWMLCALTYNSTICIWSLKVQCNETDLQKLLSFKHQVRDPSSILSSWSDKQDCCGWAGVECDHFSHRVVELSLPCSYFMQDDTNCLAGEFSLSNLLELEFLKYLDLSGNSLSFTPPGCCGNYSSNLLLLDLSRNDLEIDDLTWLIDLYSLEYLDLGGITLRSSLWLQSVSALSSLSMLFLRGCNLHDINPSLKHVNFTSLQILDLSENYFHSDKIPNWLFNLSHIQVLDLNQNSFQGHLPETILNLQNLKVLWLCDNKLDGAIPNWFGKHRNLLKLDLSGNSFRGPIPDSLGNLSSLLELSIADNPLTGNLPNSLGQLSKLESLKVYDTFLTGDISEKFFSQLSNLKLLCLGANALSFHFDPHWIPPFQLRSVILENLHPKLPVWLYTQKSLRRITIFNSNLSLEDKDKFWNFVAGVQLLELLNCSITGDLSKVVLNSKVAHLSYNNFTGGLPQLSPNVTVFILENNSFLGDLSSLLCQKMDGKSNLSFFQIHNVRLSGGLTECWMKWKSLVHISLVNNNLRGKIPESLSLLSNIKSLDLEKNNLFGYIPASLKNCQKLSILNLGENKFSGKLPYWVSRNVNILLLRSNRFSGNFPPQFCRLSSLMILDIADNRISGTIPNCLHNITALVSPYTFRMYYGFITTISGVNFRFLYSLPLLVKGNRLAYDSRETLIMHIIDLSCNNLSGTIPPETFTLTTLQSLNLSNNQLTGKVPEEIGNLKQLECLDLSSNQFNNEIPQNMSELSFLGFLNLSFNNFTGQIPSTPQFQRFDELSFIGNPGLCGAPLTKNCTQEEKHITPKPVKENDNEEEFLSCFFFGMGVGFAAGLSGFCASLFFNRTWSHTYFTFLDQLMNQLYIFVVLKKNIFR